MAAEIVHMPGAAMARGASSGDDDNTLREWLMSEVTPERPEGEIDRVTLHRADAQGHVKSRFKTVQLKGKSGERLQDVATEIALAAERDARGPLGAPIYIARLWTASGADSVSELPIIPSQAGPRFEAATSAQMQGALLGQVYNHNETLFRGAVAMMVAQSEHSSRECERLQAEANLLREKQKADAQALEDARQQNHERQMERDAAAARQKRADELMEMFKGGVDIVKARWMPEGKGGESILAKSFVELINGPDGPTVMKALAGLPESVQLKIGAIAEMAGKAAKVDTGEDDEKKPEDKK